MRGMRARYPGFEYENYQDFCDRTPETIPDQVWIPDLPYPFLEDSVGITETKTTKNVSTEEKKLKTTFSKRKQSKPDIQDNEKKPAPKKRAGSPDRRRGGGGDDSDGGGQRDKAKKRSGSGEGDRRDKNRSPERW